MKALMHLIRHEPGLVILAVGELLLITFGVKAGINGDLAQAFTLMLFAASAALTMRRWIIKHYKEHR